jgi:hypothetical protein
MRHRSRTHITFEPSAYSEGISFPSEGLRPLGPGPQDKRADYGVLLTYYRMFKLWRAAEEGEENTPGAIVRDYWWVILAATPVIYYGVNKAMDKLEK